MKGLEALRSTERQKRGGMPNSAKYAWQINNSLNKLRMQKNRLICCLYQTRSIGTCYVRCVDVQFTLKKRVSAGRKRWRPLQM